MSKALPVQKGIDGEITVDFHGNVAVVTLNRGENRINPSFLDAMQIALDKVESNPDVQVMVTTGQGKFFSIGLDLDFLGYYQQTPIAQDFMDQFNLRMFQLITRIAEFPVVTVAALNGHTYAAGACLALAHDYRIMNTDKGCFCLNEVHLGIHFSPYLLELMRHRFPSGRVFLEAVVLGRRYTAQEAKENGFVDAISGANSLTETAGNYGKSIVPKNGFQRQNLRDMKRNVLGRRMRDEVKGVDVKPASSKI